jgi:ABC-type transport system substrate-binding protein
MKYNTGLTGIVPDLATKYTWIDNKTCQFDLVQNAKFHNGRALTADDVKKTFDFAKDPKNGSRLSSDLAPVDSVEVKSPYTAIFHLKTPFAWLFDKLAYMPIKPVEQYDAGTAKTKPLGAGPFMFKEWRQGQDITWVKNPSYYNTGLPYLDQLTFKIILDYNSARSAFLAKQGDLWLSVQPADVPVLNQNATLKVQTRPRTGSHQLWINWKTKPFDNPKVRQAVYWAVNRTEILNSVFNGLGEVGYVPVPSSSPFYSKDFEYQPDIAKAKQLLTDAGFANGIDSTIICTQIATQAGAAEFVTQQLKQVGIRLTIEKMETTPFVARVQSQRDFALAIFVEGGPDFSRYLDGNLRPNGTTNSTGYDNPAVTALLDQGLAATDDKTKIATYQSALKLVNADPSEVFLVYGNGYEAFYKNVGPVAYCTDGKFDYTATSVKNPT